MAKQMEKRREQMIIKINSQDGYVKNIDINCSPVEFMIIKQILNLKAIEDVLNEVDVKTAEKMYKEIDKQLKEMQKK